MFNQPLPPMPVYDPNKNYNDAYWSLFCQNESILAKIEDISLSRDSYLKKILRIEEQYEHWHNNIGDNDDSDEYQKNLRKKHERRYAAEIAREYNCPYHGCEKMYGSEGSMNLHIKLKHKGGNKTDREKTAKHIVFCQSANLPICMAQLLVKINLPPGSIREASEQLQINL